MGPPPPSGEEKIGRQQYLKSLLFLDNYFLNLHNFYILLVIMKAVGGEMGSASALAPKLGPLGLVSLN